MNLNRLNFFYILAIFAVLLPITAEYFTATLLLLWWGSTRFFDPQNFPEDQYTQPFRKLTKALLGLATLTFIAGAVAYLSADTPQNGKLFAKGLYHLIAKQLLLPLALLGAVKAAYRRGWTLQNLAKPMAIFSLIYFLYLVVQRHTGIDWVHGLDAVLPENRFAYGVYRISGMMGHPLSLAYNMLVFGIFTLAVCWNHERFSQNDRTWWRLAAWTTLISLFLSESRWPMIILLVFLIYDNFPAICRYWRWVVGALAAGAVMLTFRAGILGRFAELFTSAQPWESRWSRLVFWHVHALMFQDHPIAGVGFGGGAARLLDYFTRAGYTNIEEKFSAHNIYLQTLADSGLIGFAGLILLLANLWIVVRSLSNDRMRRAGMALLVAVYAAGLMQNVWRDSEFLYAFWLCFSLLLAEGASMESAKVDERSRAGKSTKDYQSSPD